MPKADRNVYIFKGKSPWLRINLCIRHDAFGRPAPGSALAFKDGFEGCCIPQTFRIGMVATLASSKVTAESGQAAAMQESAAPYKTIFARVAVAIDKAPASSGKVAATRWHLRVRPWESRRLRLQLPAPGSALSQPLRTHRERRQKLPASEILQFPGDQSPLDNVRPIGQFSIVLQTRSANARSIR